MNDIDIVLITGAGRGIGKSIALCLGTQGIPVLCISKSQNAASTAHQIIERGGSAESLILDIQNYEHTEQAISNWMKDKEYQRIGIILAAATLGPKGPFQQASLLDWANCYHVNVLGNLAVIRALIPTMLTHQFGRIVTFAGGGAAYPYPLFPAYSASKTSMVRITENLHEELKEKGNFGVVCLAPGAVETDLLKQVRSEGGEIKTLTDIQEPTQFVLEFILATSCSISGSFIHVRDHWKDYLVMNKPLTNPSLWKLRRIE